MVLFDNIEEIFQKWRDFSDYSKALVTLATATGTIFILFHSVKLLYDLFNGFRLYVLSQFCCRTNFVQKYGEWAVISGSTDGIGLAMARELARRGHSIVVVGRNEEKLANTKASLEQEPNVGQVLTVKIDLSDSSIENYERIRAQIDPENRDIGILINNAGTFEAVFKRLNRHSMEDSRRMINVNILATVYLTRMIMPGMINRDKGLIVNVSSLIGQVPGSFFGCYGPTKAFVDYYTRILQDEYSSYPIDIINLTPGAVHTRLFESSSKTTKPSAFNPTPDDYAKTAINAFSIPIKSMSGCMVHGIFKNIALFFNHFGLIPSLLKLNLILDAKEHEIYHSEKKDTSADHTGGTAEVEQSRATTC